MTSISSVFYCQDFIEECSNKILANPFWSETNGIIDKLEEDQRIDYLKRILPSLGFYNLILDDELVSVQIKDNLVREVNHDDIRTFLQRILNLTPGGHSLLTRMTLQYCHFFDEKIYN